jgi:polysaccharide deacetylase 2 family uncharacterized protein YibQ
VADDDLSAPLGQHAKKRRRLPTLLPQAVAGALGLFVLVCVGWALVMDEPLGGEPAAVVKTGLPPGKARVALPAVLSPGTPVQGPRSYDGPAPPPLAPPQAEPAPGQGPAPAGPAPGMSTVTIIDGSTGKRREVPIPATQDIRAPVDARLLEVSRHGPIPRAAPDGARPAEIYASAKSPAPSKKNGPKVAIVLAGLGVGANATHDAMAKLPAPVTFAFVPYSSEVESAVTRARAGGHEVLLQVPMEPFDYPDNDPGPQTLLMSLSAEQNLDRLHWMMSRFQGYVGIANYMGARFTTTEQGLGPVMKEVSKRGLIYFDDGSSARSLAGQIAGANNLPFAKAEIVLDAVPAPAHIDRALARLEAAARERGVAVGVAAALPASIERIAQWAKAAESRGIVLVPISAVAIKPKSS